MSSWFSSAPVEEIAFIPVSQKPICEKVFNADKTMENFPEEALEKVVTKLAELKEHLTSDISTWEQFFDTKGVKGFRKFKTEDGVATMRSETVMPFHIVDIFEFITNPTKLPTVDPVVNHVKALQRFTPHTWVGCITLHGQWPVISPREFVDLYHWQLLEDGSILYLLFSMFFDELKPENEEAVRGWNNLQGYLLRPTEDGSGTDVHMIFDSDPRGDFPTALVNQGMLNQPNSLCLMRDGLVKLSDAGNARDVTLPARYEDFLGAIAKNSAL